jgi:hypothetical protein
MFDENRHEQEHWLPGIAKLAGVGLAVYASGTVVYEATDSMILGGIVAGAVMWWLLAMVDQKPKRD